MKKRVKHNLFDFFFNNANIFTVTYDQFDASLLNKSISFKSIIYYLHLYTVLTAWELKQKIFCK